MRGVFPPHWGKDAPERRSAEPGVPRRWPGIKQWFKRLRRSFSGHHRRWLGLAGILPREQAPRCQIRRLAELAHIAKGARPDIGDELELEFQLDDGKVIKVGVLSTPIKYGRLVCLFLLAPWSVRLC
jgi:hypothetical protein